MLRVLRMLLRLLRLQRNRIPTPTRHAGYTEPDDYGTGDAAERPVYRCASHGLGPVPAAHAASSSAPKQPIPH